VRRLLVLHLKVDAFSSLSHYSAHIRPVWEALPPSLRGQWWTPANLPRSDRLTIVASYRDAQAIGRPYVLVEHGAGSVYVGHERNGSYPGGEGHDRCVLFLCPSQRVAGLWRERYPDTPAVVCGCPRLDKHSEGPGRRVELPGGPIRSHEFGLPGLHNVGTSAVPATLASHVLVARGTPNESDSGKKSEKSLPTVAVTFHADLAVCPETRSAWRYYDPHLPRLVADPRFRVVGHGHPRLWPTLRHRWSELGVDQWPDVDQVLSEVDLLVVDNSSVAFEFAAIGKPVVLLNLPSYRRDVEHGGRFWTSPPGIQCDHPSELADTICRALADPPAHRAIRARAVEWAYSAVDGHASERAAAAIMEVLNG
jgi:glycosyltransferase involved in cell wall biosynthesis